MNRRSKIAVLVLALVALAGCTRVSAEPDQTGIHYEDGPFSSKKYASIVAPAHRESFGPGDKVYMYPNGQRSYDATGGPNAEHDPFTSSSSDSVELATPLSVTFELKTDAPSLRAFHERIGLKYQAWYDSGTKSPTGVSDGWGHILDFYIGQSIDNTVDRVLAGYAWRDAYGKADVRNAIQKAIQEELPGAVSAKMQAGDFGGFFQNFAVQVQRPTPTNPELLKNIAAAQTQVALAQAAKDKADADLKTANAQIAVQKAEASKKEADISAYGSVQEYNKAQAIDKGINPYQPTYVVSGTAPSNK
jgi:ribosomal protein L9